MGGIHAINDLYVRFNAEATAEMEAEAREYFRLIESGDKEACELFEWFKSLTLEYVKAIYEKLNITFDSYAGERFYTDKMQPVIDELRAKNLLKESEGAQIVDLEEYGMPPCLILRSDGASLTPRVIWRRPFTVKIPTIFTNAFTLSRISKICTSSSFLRFWN